MLHLRPEMSLSINEVIIVHDGEVKIDNETVRDLLIEQYPQVSRLPLVKINSTRTVNAIYRIGNDFYARLPLLPEYNEAIINEINIIQKISSHVTIRIPEPIYLGSPSEKYLLNWAVYKWIDGEAFHYDLIGNKNEMVEQLVQFISELHSIKLFENTPHAGRKPLIELDKITAEKINQSKNEVDSKRLFEIWNELKQIHEYYGKSVMIHADLLKPNILMKNRRINAIIDFGSAGKGDPCFDMIAAWSLLKYDTRQYFRNLLNIDDTIWNRACAYALHQAVLIIPYYKKTNPKFVELAKDTIKEILEEYK
jgi:aminoglycoside phosphotransferase (APT) family kinase protein